MGPPDVWGAVGTWVVGVLALLIAILQYVGSIFRPSADARLGPVAIKHPATRIVVNLRNRGGSPGMVVRVWVVADPDHKIDVDVDFPGWSRDRPPYPFMLAGRSTAVIIMDLKEDIKASARVLIEYDRGRQHCVAPHPVTSSLAPNRTQLPPDSLAIMETAHALTCLDGRRCKE
jgi:hypothetical protein